MLNHTLCSATTTTTTTKKKIKDKYDRQGSRICTKSFWLQLVYFCVFVRRSDAWGFSPAAGLPGWHVRTRLVWERGDRCAGRGEPKKVVLLNHKTSWEHHQHAIIGTIIGTLFPGYTFDSHLCGFLWILTLFSLTACLSHTEGDDWERVGLYLGGKMRRASVAQIRSRYFRMRVLETVVSGQTVGLSASTQRGRKQPLSSSCSRTLSLCRCFHTARFKIDEFIKKHGVLNNILRFHTVWQKKPTLLSSHHRV